MSRLTVNLANKVTLPDLEYINELAEEKGFIFGRNFANPPAVLQDLYSLFREENKDPLAFDVKQHILSQEKIEKDILFEQMSESQKAYYKYTALFLVEQVDYEAIPGVTPLDKSLNVLMYLTHLSGETNPQPSEYDGANPEQEQIEIPDEETLSRAIKDMSNGVSTDTKSPDEEYETKKEMTKCIRDHLYDLNPHIAHIYGKTRPADMPINKRILDDIKIKNYLESAKGLETGLETKKVRNNDSNEKDRFQMESHDQVSKLSKQDLVKETFEEKFIKKELVVKEKVKPETKKQMLYVLLDDSGSMNNLTKQTYVRAVLLNRLESVVKGDSEVKFCLYESERYGFQEVKTKEDAKKLFKTISVRRPSGGGTYIGHVIQETIDEIHNIPGYHHPELMIVCDGDDHVNPNDVNTKGVRINAILLGRNNPGIVKLCKATNGFYSVEDLY